MRCVVVLLLLWTLFVAASTVSGDNITTPAPIDCGVVRSTDIKRPMLSETKSEDDKLVTTVSCDEGYLLVPQNGSIVQCDSKTGEWIFPNCSAIPSVGFIETDVTHNMTIPELRLALKLTEDVVRKFDVNVSVENTGATAEEGSDFELTNKTVHFEKEKKEDFKFFSVNITDSRMSGINKHFRLCLSIGTSHWNETRAILTESSKCINVTINNNNLAGLVLPQSSYIFTSASQSLTFFVGYRTCDIHVIITISKESEEYTTTAVISRDCSACVVDLVDQGSPFNFTKEMVGDYSAVLVAGDDCKVNNSRMDFQIQVTLTPDEVMEKGIEVKLVNATKAVEVDINDPKWPSQLLIPIQCTTTPQYIFQLKLSVIEDEVAVIGSVEVDVHPSKCPPNIDLSQSDVIIDHINNSCLLKKRYGVRLDVLTVPSIAVVPSSQRHGYLLVSHVIDVQFDNTSYVTLDDNVPSVKIISSTCIDLPRYITVCILSRSDDQTSCHKNLTYKRSGDYSNTWDVGDLGDKLQSLTLSIQLLDEEHQNKAFPHLPQTVTFTSGAVLNFVKGPYHYEDKIKIESSRKMDGVKLNELVKLKCEEFDITDDVPATGSNTSQWEITVTQKKPSKEPPTQVNITMEVAEHMIGIITLGSLNLITVSKAQPETTSTSPPPTSDSELLEPEETTSFSFATLIGVFIVVLVIGVAVYVGVSRREQIVTWVRSNDGEGGGPKGIITKARTRLRSRGMYKKLPTSVQEAMTRHND